MSLRAYGCMFLQGVVCARVCMYVCTCINVCVCIELTNFVYIRVCVGELARTQQEGIDMLGVQAIYFSQNDLSLSLFLSHTHTGGHGCKTISFAIVECRFSPSNFELFNSGN